jgi:hypothetical protein
VKGLAKVSETSERAIPMFLRPGSIPSRRWPGFRDLLRSTIIGKKGRKQFFFEKKNQKTFAHK